jgi:hypothetical protein
MTHYICTGGCKGVSKVAKNCGAKDCPKHDQLLTPCECSDNNHNGAF